MQKKDEIYRLALAGLLHDIGKFAQRAGDELNRSWNDETRREFKYQHALHTWNFIEKYIPETFDVGVLAAYHHRPQNAAQQRIRLADQLSAGERDSGQDQDDSDRKTYPRQLHPIFTQIVTNGEPHPYKGEKKFYYALKPLALQEKVLFPQESPLAEENVWNAYGELWNGFCQEAKDLRTLSLEAYLEAMQALIQRYTWCIPSAYYNAVPDVSLYDHSRTTAALAVCLSDFEDEKIESLTRDWQAKGGELWNEPVALLLGGDISGVQDFIYTITSKGAAKSLRGRSFYLQLLTEAVLRFALHELGLPYTNVIYSGGGHFFLLAPLSAQKNLPEIQAAISRKMLKHHGTALYLALGAAEVPLSGFKVGRFTDYWEIMHHNLQEAKSHRYTELGEEMHEFVFAVPEDGGGDKHCVVCGADDVQLSKWKEDGEEEEEKWICPQCLSYSDDLGKHLPKKHVVRWRQIESQDRPRGKFKNALNSFGAEITLLDWDDISNVQPGDSLWLMEDIPGGKELPTAANWLHYTVNQIPMDAKQPITFDKLQEQCKSGFQRLGVVRLDVDNLGEVFKNGLGEKASLSRLSALSSQLSLFFEGWIKKIIARDGRDASVYAVYAGGDDVFLLGPWDVMPSVALDIQHEFQKYTGHPALHLSGGMAFIDGKYPVYQAAADAGAAEHLAKSRRGKDDKDQKNAFAFLGTPWRWDTFEEVTQKQERLYQLVRGTEEESGSPKSLLMLLRSLAKMESEAAEGETRPVWGRWMWMGAYHLTRAIERNKKKNNPALAQELDKILTDFEHNHYRDLPQWGAAARWAQLKVRNRKETKKMEASHE